MDATGYLWVLRVCGALMLLAGFGFVLAGRAAPAAGLIPALAALALGAWRTSQVGHLPLAGLHETLLTFGLCVVWVSAVSTLSPAGNHVFGIGRRGARPASRDDAGPAAFIHEGETQPDERRRRSECTWYLVARPLVRDTTRVYGTCLVFAGLLWVLSSLADPRPTPLVPALQTRWFEIHVASSFLAYACFLLAAVAGAAYLVGGRTSRVRRLLEGAHRWGFAWFTWGMVSGGIWAYLAWGTYWLWHVKELWSGVVWIYYAGAVHLSHMPRWRGRRQAVVSLVGLGLVLFTYLGVGLLMRNTHRF